MKKKIKLSVHEYTTLRTIITLLRLDITDEQAKLIRKDAAVRLASRRFEGEQRDYIIKLIIDYNYKELDVYTSSAKIVNPRRDCCINGICALIISMGVGIPLAKAIKNRI